MKFYFIIVGISVILKVDKYRENIKYGCLNNFPMIHAYKSQGMKKITEFIAVFIKKIESVRRI